MRLALSPLRFFLAALLVSSSALAQGPPPDFTHASCYLGPEAKDFFGCCHAPTWGGNTHLELRLKKPTVTKPRLCFNKGEGINFEYQIQHGSPGKGLQTPIDGSAVVGLGLVGGGVHSIRVYSDPPWCLSWGSSPTVHLSLDDVPAYPQVSVAYWFGMISISRPGNSNVVVYAQTGSVKDIGGNIWIAEDCNAWAADVLSGRLHLNPPGTPVSLKLF